LTLKGPFGTVTLDKNRQAIVDTTVQQLVLDGDKVVSKTVAQVRGVDQTFGGTFSETTPLPGRDAPGCDARTLPWVGKAIPVVDGVPQG
jgi:branched-chain amino acid transport system substrate-binding protein